MTWTFTPRRALAAVASLLLALLVMGGCHKGPSNPNRWESVTDAVGAPTAAALAAPVRPLGIANIAEKTTTACDPTGHCARLHVVVQVQDAAQIRSFASIACYSSSGDFPCRALQGNTWLNCELHGVDCSVDGPITSCGAMYGKPACPAVLNVVSPWLGLGIESRTYSGAAAFQFTTGAAGGGTHGISAVTVEFGF